MTSDTGKQTAAPPRGRPASPSPRAVLGALRTRLLGGDRPYVLGFLAVLGLAVVILSGPVRTWAEQRDRIEQREAVLEVLEQENGRLAERVEDLNDPDTIEAEAREEQGMYRPGEVPYVVVPPAVDQPQLRPDAAEDDGEGDGWFSRLREAVADILGG